MTPPSETDLSQPRRIHVVGVGGAGMSAIALVLAGRGHTVSGSDLHSSPVLERLGAAGIRVAVGHDAANVGDAELVTHSTAIPLANPELENARSRGLPVMRRAEILALLTRVWRTVAVAGTHGKTTTSAMLTTALRGAGLDPAFIVGGNLRDLDSGASVGSGDLLVVEADESDGTFVELDAEAVVVTNVEPDHLEHYGGFEGLEKAFVQFVTQAPGPRVLCIDDPGAAALAALVTEVRSDGPAPITYGVAPEATWRIVDPLPTPSGISFTVSSVRGDVQLALRQPGMHNARNAAGALATAVELGADLQRAAEALSAFGGVGRRFERRGRAAGIDLVDDYAHLPTEVEAAIAAARSLKPERLVVAFQPHRYSRTEQLWSTFGDAFQGADVLFVTGIYSSGEAPRPGVSGELIANIVTEHHPERDVRYIEDLGDLPRAMLAELRSGDLCLTLGAGDLTRIPDLLLDDLQRQ
ncbi:MAG: UDP-N-acetylmuramate--L-alanine ligase [Acidimicrobiia bacterium]|nr:UDP-N-acetylmuramate--L-alanine ligase [Acidimicrobiia bacterium]